MKWISNFNNKFILFAIFAAECRGSCISIADFCRQNQKQMLSVLGHHEGAATGDHPHWAQEQLYK
jgi:hypothetical protein